MSVTINASTSSGLIQTADTSGNLELQSNGTTKLTVSSTGVAITGASLTSFAGGAITSGTAVASTSGTSIDFTSIPSWVKRITVMLNGVSTSGSSFLQIQIGAGSVATSGYLSSTSGGTTGNVLGGTTSTTGFAITGFTDATYSVNGTFVISTIGSNTWVENGILNTNTIANAYMSSGRIVLGGTLDRVRITTVNGTDTFDLGSINILYEG
jgi:hypothetical protein